MKRTYFDGPAGVYYDPEIDELYTLKKCGVRLFNLEKHIFAGSLYDLEGAHVAHNEIAICMTREWIRIGEL